MTLDLPKKSTGGGHDLRREDQHRENPEGNVRPSCRQRFFGETEESQEEYSVLDKAHRVQLSGEILEKAGIDFNKVKIEVIDGKIVISRAKAPDAVMFSKKNNQTS